MGRVPLAWTHGPSHMDLQLSPQNENVLFCKVEMSYSQTSVALAIPLWMHDVASRPAVKATLRRIEPRGLDDTRPRCEGRTVMDRFTPLATATELSLAPLADSKRMAA